MTRLNVGNIRHPDASADSISLDSSARVGINTSSPTAPLSVVGGTGADPTIYLVGASNDNARIGSKLNLVLACNEDGNQSNRAIQFNNHTSEFARLDSSGRLLVGTSSDSRDSSVVIEGNSGGSTAAGVIRLARGTSTPGASDDLGFLMFGDSGHNGASQILARRDGGTWTSGSSEPSSLIFRTTADGASSATERMRIDSSGNVGIGTSTVNAKVEIAANNNGAAENNTLRFTDTDTSTQDNQQIGKIEFHSSDASTPGAGVKAYIGAFATDTTPDAYLAFATQDGSAVSTPVERLRIKSDGKVGIGTTAPGDTLHVAGNGLFYSSASEGGIFVGGNSLYNWSIQRENVSTGRLDFANVNNDTRTTRMTLDANGRLGIGTTSPSDDFTFGRAVDLASTTGGFYYVRDTDATNGVGGIGLSGTDLYIVNKAAGNIRFFNNDNTSERMRITSAGRVGINESNPDTALHVKRSDSGPTTIRIHSGATSSNNGDEYASLVFWGSGDYAGGKIASHRDHGTYNDRGDLRFYSGYGNNTFTEVGRFTNTGDLRFNSGYGSVATAYGVRAWINFNGTGTPAARGSGNVSSVTDYNTGRYTVSFSTAMPDANYCVVASGNRDVTGAWDYPVNIPADAAPSTSSVRVVGHHSYDYEYMFVAIIR